MKCVRTPTPDGYPPEPPAAGEQAAGNVMPFLIHNLDTGETSVMERAWTKYQRDHRTRAQAKAAQAKVAPTPGMPRAAERPPPPPPQRQDNGSGGSFWMQSV